VLGEEIKPAEWLTYIPIWIAVALLALEGTRLLIVRPASPPILP
jgi:chloramphenicol-sensitive protein RarD